MVHCSHCQKNDVTLPFLFTSTTYSGLIRSGLSVRQGKVRHNFSEFTSVNFFVDTFFKDNLTAFADREIECLRNVIFHFSNTKRLRTDNFVSRANHGMHLALYSSEPSGTRAPSFFSPIFL